MTDEALAAVRDFHQSFEAVFGSDWQYTKSMLGISDDTPEQADASRQLGLESIPVIATTGTFLAPGINDKGEDWGHRGMLLDRYRRLKRLIQQSEESTIR